MEQGPTFQIGGQAVTAARWPNCGEVIDMTDACEVYDRDHATGLKRILQVLAAFLGVDEAAVRLLKPKEVRPMLERFFQPEPEDADAPTP